MGLLICKFCQFLTELPDATIYWQCIIILYFFGMFYKNPSFKIAMSWLARVGRAFWLTFLKNTSIMRLGFFLVKMTVDISKGACQRISTFFNIIGYANVTGYR